MDYKGIIWILGKNQKVQFLIVIKVFPRRSQIYLRSSIDETLLFWRGCTRELRPRLLLQVSKHLLSLYWMCHLFSVLVPYTLEYLWTDLNTSPSIWNDQSRPPWLPNQSSQIYYLVLYLDVTDPNLTDATKQLKSARKSTLLQIHASSLRKNNSKHLGGSP